MELAKGLDVAIAKISALKIPPSQRDELLGLARYLKTQALCDLDRRATRYEIGEAASTFVRKMYEASILATLNQPQKFWNDLELFASTKLTVIISPSTDQKPDFSKWSITDFFQHLLGEVSKMKPSPEQGVCRLGLTALANGSLRKRETRNMQNDKTIWQTQVHPFLKKTGILDPFRGDKLLKVKLEFHLMGEWKKRPASVVSRLGLGK